MNFTCSLGSTIWLQQEHIKGSDHTPTDPRGWKWYLRWNCDGNTILLLQYLLCLYDITDIFHPWEWSVSLCGSLSQTVKYPFRSVFADVRAQRQTHCNTKQSPLDSRPSVQPAIDDQDETYVRWWQAATKNKEQCWTQSSSDQISPDRGFVVEEPSMWTWITHPFKQQLKEAKTNKTYILFSPCGMKNKSKCLLDHSTAALLCCSLSPQTAGAVHKESCSEASPDLLATSRKHSHFFPVPPTPSLLHSCPTLSEERGTRPHRDPAAELTAGLKARCTISKRGHKPPGTFVSLHVGMASSFICLRSSTWTYRLNYQV